MIIIIDDVIEVPRSLKVLLDKEGFQVKIFQDSRMAVHFIKKNHEDIGLIITDVLMPELGGFELAEKIKASEETQNIPFIFISSSYKESDVDKAFQLGAIDFISKPFNEQLFIKKIISVAKIFDDTHKKANTILEGNLKDNDLHLLLALCDTEKLNGFLKVSKTTHYFGILKLEQGHLVDMAIFHLVNNDIVHGTDALDKMMTWKEGLFSIRKGSTEEYDDIFPPD